MGIVGVGLSMLLECNWQWPEESFNFNFYLNGAMGNGK
jgi:hypothetical protein